MDEGLRLNIHPPVFRRLRVFAIDPGMTARFETAVLNEMTLSIPWEPLAPGPVGEYIAVVDENEAGERLHDPVDLDRPEILAQDGLAPSDGNPQFRQQMVYAVAMRTIRNFERALGRVVHWPPRVSSGRGRGKTAGPPAYEKRLSVHPHYMPDANAYYDPAKGFCFGYFESLPESPVPGTTVFSCLSQDVIAHELTHALLMGMRISFDGHNPDVAAFHEAFSDLVALLQHFGLSDVLRHQIASIRGRLDAPSPLGAVALQFGQAMNMRDGLRNALGYTDEAGQWHARVPDPTAYAKIDQPHMRGDILVGAVFEALKKTYESRVADLRRIASKGTGILPEGSLHPDLVNRFAQEASRSAQRVLELCLRALDYIPPVEITFGDYLRAIVTADYDVAPADEANYRLAFVDAFRRYGILPAGVGTLSQETLLWPEAPVAGDTAGISAFVKNLSRERTPWNLPSDRQALWELLEEKRAALQEWLATQPAKRLGPIDLRKPFEVQSFHPRERSAVSGDLTFQWVIKLVQAAEPKVRSGKRKAEEPPPLSGVTLLVDGNTGRVRYQIETTTSAARARAAKRRAPILGTPATIRPPAERRLRVFAFDPSLGVQLETAGINEVTIRVPWERSAEGEDILAPGPMGEYLEVVDRDPASGCFYDPIDLNHPFVVAQDGLPPSEASPQFHQQMVYAVAMRTIRNFEQSLGRLALWRPHRIRNADGKIVSEDYVRRLRLYPHALREANAYYSPEKKAVLFGYFPAPVAEGGGDSARLTVFTCLSHDIIAHEVTHALLDGMHRRFSEPSNPDVLAFHEAFADLVALFQHFSLPDVLRHQIASTRGDLASQNRLGELAQQFGQAIGKRGALRNAIGETDPKTGQWRRLEADPGDYSRHEEPHDRGAVLVAAVFDAFLSIYKGRVADLLRIASEGTGVLPAGSLHPDLVNRLTDEAARSARHVLEMCIRALDYCPPVDITFGDYLRAIVTADHEHDPVDDEHRRVAFVEAFRRRGIVPEGVQAFSVDGLLWRPASAAPDEDEEVVVGIIREWAADISSWGLSKDRQGLYELMTKRRAALNAYLRPKLSKESVVLGSIDPELPFEVHSLRPSIRMDWEGKPTFQWVIELTQRVPQYLHGDGESRRGEPPDYYFRGGCTLLVDAQTGRVRYSIKKRLDDARKERQRQYAREGGNRSLAATYFGGVTAEQREPFAMLHRH
ncbi:MAG: peptidase and subtilisin kexin sedolisin [Proteobacteria bacterium]|nr:peptidase and subtilisin kexin sedolisin [Pseudomonadota bacterium]